MESTELDLLDRHVRDRAELHVEDLIVNDDNFDEDERHFVRYEIQLKYNEGRYSAIYIVSKQVCDDNNIKDVSGLYALKTGLRNGSSTFNIRMKRELRILAEMSKAKASWAPPFFDSGSVCDMPFIVMGLLDMNIDKLREMLGGKFRPSSVFYIAGEVLHALSELHARGFVHRDVKPTNICVGVGPLAARVYLIDYGDTVRIGKRIRYGTPDAYTLPYWSIETHRRRAATEKTDFEGWFYTIADLFVPSIVSWKGELSEPDIEKAKTDFWSDFQSAMAQSPPALLAIAETFHAAEEKVDVARLKKFVRVGMEQSLSATKKYVPEWIRGSNTATAIGSRSKARSVPKEAAAT
ncbi:Protein kinase domain-containing protein [Trichostrongylus colubriformis]|uniref:non-specific serine/threonine protein kinase n=1 Tax=Trichostrongylus colubriformis TaxID=6319 RepID=A0AAN8FRB4_TRICO